MSFINLLFPTRELCYICKDKTPYLKDFICSECNDRLNYIHQEITIDSLYISRAFYSLNYNRFVRELIHGFKFNEKSYLYKPFAEIMIKTLRNKDLIDNIDILFFVPIHIRKEAIRGYNQTELLADYISKKLDIPISKRNLIKVKLTKEQNKLSRKDRLNNLSDSFILRNSEEIKNKRILIIDDLITTGSTMNECAKILINNGASKVITLALTSSNTKGA